MFISVTITLLSSIVIIIQELYQYYLINTRNWRKRTVWC